MRCSREAPPPGPGARLHGEPRPGVRLDGRGPVPGPRARGGGDGRVRGALRRARRGHGPLESGGARLRGAASGGRADLRHPVRDPHGRGSRLQRRGDRGRAGGGRPHVRAGCAAVRARAGDRGTSRQRGRRALGGFVICGEGEPVRFDPPPGLEGVLARPPGELRTAEARAALPDEVPLADAVHNVANAAHAGAGPFPRRHVTRGPRPRDHLHQPRRRALYPASMELLERAVELGAVGATISGAGPTVLFWCDWQATGALVERLRPRCPSGTWRGCPSPRAARTCTRCELRDPGRGRGGEARRRAGAAGAPAPVRRLDPAQGQARPRRVLGGGRAARGGGGGVAALPAGRGAPRLRVPRSGDARSGCATGGWSRWRISASRPTTRWTRCAGSTPDEAAELLTLRARPRRARGGGPTMT